MNLRKVRIIVTNDGEVNKRNSFLYNELVLP